MPPRKPIQKGRTNSNNVIEPMEVDDQPISTSRKRTQNRSKGEGQRIQSKKRKTVAEKLSEVLATVLPAKLYTFGLNTCGALGYNAEQRRYPFLVPALKDEKIKAVACGGMHTLVLGENGKVYSFGCNDDEQLGRPTENEEQEEDSEAEEEETEDDETEPGEVLNLPKIVVQISVGDNHSAALTEDGKVYAWGCFKNENFRIGLVPPDSGENGNDDDEDDQSLCRQDPQEITKDVEQKIIKIASGINHLVMLAENGHLYTCGSNEEGQLGRAPPPDRRVTRSMSKLDPTMTGEGLPENDKRHLLKPARVYIGHSCKVVNVWAGGCSTYALAANSSLYVWGSNGSCQLGIPHQYNASDQYGNKFVTNNIIPLPTKINSFQGKSWKQIAVGLFHIVALDDEGKVYTLGLSTDSRLGLGVPLTKRSVAEADVSVPTLVPGLSNKKCVRVAAGGSTSYAVTEDGHLFSWGFGENLQLATGDDEDREQPFQCKGGKDGRDIDGEVVCVQAGGQHVAITIANN